MVHTYPQITCFYITEQYNALKMKTVLWDFNAGVGEETYLYPTCGGHSLHNKTNDNGKQM